MKRSHRLEQFAVLSVVAALAGVWSFLPADIAVAEPSDTSQAAAIGQRTFATPDDAVAALRAATQTQDKAALRQIFGPEFDHLLTGDAAQDAKNADKFAAAVAQACKPVSDGQDTMTLEIGTNNWPMPIPLVKADGQWHFDTAAGKDEIIARHIGKDELHAIGVCRAYVKAQQQYASLNAGSDSSYAQQFKSTPGKKDGLYWPTTESESPSPFGPALAEAQTGENVNNTSTGAQPFHGYFFRILTCQGPAAPGGKKNYMSQDKLSGGFALVAYPEHWDQSGIMTFIVNQDGIVYERNLGPETSRHARRMKAYNPDNDWQQVQDEGLLKAVSEKMPL
ncbi:MAG TPA: DUF2950 domain-containing protein [Verrucomicrobiae bacterium]|jgi:hypothetical protein|nr:DUF2950 domain-containing protein [Verrucomicrobiae bacterium]